MKRTQDDTVLIYVRREPLSSYSYPLSLWVAKRPKPTRGSHFEQVKAKWAQAEINAGRARGATYPRNIKNPSPVWEPT